MTRLSTLLLAGVLIISCAGTPADSHETKPVRTGAQTLIADYAGELAGRNIGLVMNPTARIYGTHVLDSLMSLGINVVALYAPEHGFRGDYGAGERISDGIDEETGLPVFSLYGTTRKPTRDMLEGVDLLIFDMQDVGARFYTYLSTMGLVMEAAADYGVELWILDRPNPAGGTYISGWMRQEEHTSFVGAYPIPIAHGMTLGELAHMIVGEGWLELSNPDAVLNYRVIPVQHWDRTMLWPETGLPWVPPSPNLPTFEHAFVYLGTCLVEGTTMSEGRGTDNPFLLIGAPDLMIPPEVVQELASTYSLEIRDTTFTPVEIPGRALRPKHQNTEVSGVYIRVTDQDFASVDPVAFGHAFLRLSLRYSPTSRTNTFLKRLAGTDRIMDFLESEEVAAAMWMEEVEAFRTQREPYLLY